MPNHDRPKPKDIIGNAAIANLAMHGYAVLDTASVVAALEATRDNATNIAKSVTERQKSIRMGARRSKGKFSLT